MKAKRHCLPCFANAYLERPNFHVSIILQQQAGLLGEPQGYRMLSFLLLLIELLDSLQSICTRLFVIFRKSKSSAALDVLARMTSAPAIICYSIVSSHREVLFGFAFDEEKQRQKLDNSLLRLLNGCAQSPL